MLPANSALTETCEAGVITQRKRSVALRRNARLLSGAWGQAMNNPIHAIENKMDLLAPGETMNKNPAGPEPTFEAGLVTRHAAYRLRISRRLLDRWGRSGVIRSRISICGVLLYSPADVEQLRREIARARSMSQGLPAPMLLSLRRAPATRLP